MRKLKIGSRLADEDGYTLTEMLVVILIISLIAAVLTPSLLGQLARAKAKTAGLQLENTIASLAVYRDDVGHFPTAAQGLSALVTDPGEDSWSGPYLKSQKALSDPWGRKLLYDINDQGVATVTSLGADGRKGGKGADLDLITTVN
jgi:general secretion pathway protein G